MAALADRLGIRDLVEVFAASHLGFATTGRWRSAAGTWRRSTRATRRSWRSTSRAIEAHPAGLSAASGARQPVFRGALPAAHEYRRFFFMDPELPASCCLRDWRGGAAAQLFQAYHALLARPGQRLPGLGVRAPPSARRRAAPRPAAAHAAAAELLAAGYARLTANGRNISGGGPASGGLDRSQRQEGRLPWRLR